MPAFVAQASTVAGAAATSITPTLPTGWQPGHVVLLNVTHDIITALATTPAGWTRLGATSSTGDHSAYLFYRVMQSGDTAPVVSWDTAGEQAAVASAWSGVNTTSPIDAFVEEFPASQLTIVSNGITTVTDNSLVVMVTMIDIGSSSVYSWSPDAATTEVYDLDVDSGLRGWQPLATSEVRATAGATGSRTHTITGSAPSAQQARVFTVALAPAGSVGPASQNVSITNTGGATLSWTASKTQAWLTLSPTSGTTTSETDTITVTASPTGLAVGVYTDTITITDSGATNSPQTVAVTFNVTAKPAILEQKSFRFRLNDSATLNGAFV